MFATPPLLGGGGEGAENCLLPGLRCRLSGDYGTNHGAPCLRPVSVIKPDQNNSHVVTRVLPVPKQDSFPDLYSRDVGSLINNNTDAGLHVVIELVGEHIYTITLCVCVCVPIKESNSLVDSYVDRTY